MFCEVLVSGEISRLDYAPFGEDFRPTAERYKFTGKEDDGSTGLQYFNARYYDPAIGRFITEDSAKDGINWYVYCGNSPLRYVDLDGERKVDITLHVAYQHVIKQEIEQPVPPNLMSDPRGDILKYAEVALPAYAATKGDPDLFNYYSIVTPVVAKAYAYYSIADAGGKAAKYTLDRNNYEFQKAVQRRFIHNKEEGNFDAEIEVRTSFGRVYVDGEKVASSWNPIEWLWWR